jgi:hypothetical protein
MALGVALCCAALACALGGCAEECEEPEVCDISERSCQQLVMRSVACLRGSDPIALPKVTVVDEAGLRSIVEEQAEAKAREEAEQEGTWADELPSDPELDERFARWSRGLSLLRLSSPDYMRQEAEDAGFAEIAAAYLYRSKEIVVVDRGAANENEDAVALLAHETVHAMQDAEHDLAAYRDEWSSDFDSDLALTSLIEGEAVLYQLLTHVSLAGRTPEELDWKQLFDTWRSDELREGDEDEAPLSRARSRFSYAFGGGFVAQHWLARGRAGIDLLFERPPSSTAEVMFDLPQADLQDARADLRERALPDLGEGYEPMGWTRAGAWVARMYAARAGAEGSLRLRPAEVLRADTLSIHWNERENRVATAWRVRVSEPQALSHWLSEAGAADGSFKDWRAAGDREAYVVLRETDPVGVSGGAPVEDELAWTAPPESDEDTADESGARTISLPVAHHPFGARRLSSLVDAFARESVEERAAADSGRSPTERAR